MSQIEVTIVRADTGAAFDVQLPEDQQVSSILSEVVSAMGLPRLGPDGDVIDYELSNKRTGDWVRDGTLESKGIKIGDVLLLTSTFVAGVGRHDFRLHAGGAPAFDPSKAAILGPPTLGAPSVPTFAALDLVEEQALRAEGLTRFFRDEPSREWLTLGRDHSFLGAIVLRRVGPNPGTSGTASMGPVVGARVVLRLQGEGEGTVLFDLMTAASGSTVTLPQFAIMAIRGSRIRVEVEAPGSEGKLVRVALHAVVER